MAISLSVNVQLLEPFTSRSIYVSLTELVIYVSLTELVTVHHSDESQLS